MYLVGNKVSKRDKLGIHKIIENTCLEVLKLLLQASFENQSEKISSLEKSRVQIEVLKNLVRTEHELKIIQEKTYIDISVRLVEISKMTNGWIQYIKKQKSAS